jgi:GNAT superfamily N-acetyltransferase
MILKQAEQFAYRIAMPQPLPEGVTFHHLKNIPAVQARHNGQAIGTLKWNGNEDDYDHGEVQKVDVHPDYQNHGVATKLFDLAKRIEPTLRHSVTQTPAGAAWSKYEESR